ncbi:MAG TPA: hypothetical protein VD913_02115 [bacterium]|nr:hypothetical protein [bacterium]
MIKYRYDPKINTLIIEFEGKIDAVQAEQFYPEIQKIVPEDVKDFRLLSDFTNLDEMDFEVRSTIKKTMDFFNQRGVTEIVRVIPDPGKDIGFGIMSLFHYSKNVIIVTLKTRQEAEEHLKNG